MSRFQSLLALSLIFFAAALAVPPVYANPACDMRDVVVQQLTETVGQELVGMGLHNRGIVEVYTSDETGKWTIVLTLPTGQTCLIALGEYWVADPTVPTTGSGA